IFVTHWQGFEVDAVELSEKFLGVDVITYNVQIPLKRAAIQVKLCGPADQREALDNLLAQVLSGLEGESNWTPAGSTSRGKPGVDPYGIFLLSLAIIVIVLGIVGFFIIPRIAPKGVLLLVAFAIYVCGTSLGQVRTREVLVMSGTMLM